MIKSFKKAAALLTLAGVVMASGSAFAMPRGHLHHHDRHINRIEQRYNRHVREMRQIRREHNVNRRHNAFRHMHRR